MTHPSAEQLAAHVDHRLVGAEREAMLHHLVSCTLCRRELTESARLLRALPARSRRPFLPRAASVAALIAAAAVLVVLVRPAPTPPGSVEQGHAQRLADPDMVAPIDVVGPADGEQVTGDPLSLIWHGVGSDVTYEVTLQDAVGRVLRTWTTSDSSVIVPGDVTGPGTGAYYWFVDALRPDGRSTRSRAHRFVR